jgi:hypothetical protein
MAEIDRFLEYPAIEMQPGQLAIDEPLGAGGDCQRRFGGDVFFCNFNNLGGFHEVLIHLRLGALRVYADAVRTM